MAEYCTCGAQLPPDALFCHKCGKPERELVAPEIEANTYAAAPVVAAVAPPPIPQPQPLPLNFHNPIAVRIALVAAVSATMLGLLLPRMPFVSWLAGGFFAVYLYCRKTGFRVDVASGVKIGWITGLILYGLFAIVITSALLPAAISGNLGKILMEQMQNPVQDPAKVQEAAKMVADNPGMVMVLLLGVLFVLVTCLSMAGGALGAKLVGSPK
jgi:hypothetical protein